VKGRRIPQLDGLRGIAILLVLTLHTLGGVNVLGFAGRVLNAGWIGVDLFFVLSGFLITKTLLEARGQDRFLTNFYARRALRIWPLYYALLLFAIVAGPHLPGAFRYERSDYAWQWHALFVQNLVLPSSVGPWPLGATWSLAIEEQFYVVWPLLILSLRANALKAFLLVVIATVPALRLALLLLGTAPLTIYITTLGRIDALAMGALIAAWIQPKGAPSDALARWGRWASVLLLPVSVAIVVFILRGRGVIGSRNPVSTPEAFAMASVFSLVALGFAGLLVAALSGGAGSLHRVLVFRPLRFVGEISYGLYLLHGVLYGWSLMYVRPAILQLLDGRRVAASVANLIVFSAVLLAVTYASWRWFERPFLRLKRHFA
jgi:peptidoglycan/LPS O-acetylase OafA/YrhL